MTMATRPTDGLVSRLLQQTQRHASETSEEPKAKPADQVSISSQARQQSHDSQIEEKYTNSFGYKQEKLESQLLNLYNKNDQPRVKD